MTDGAIEKVKIGPKLANFVTYIWRGQSSKLLEDDNYKGQKLFAFVYSIKVHCFCVQFDGDYTCFTKLGGHS